MDTHLPFQTLPVSTPLPVSSSSLTDVLQTIAALQACPTSCIPSTSTGMLSPNLPFSATIPRVNLFPPSQPANSLILPTIPAQPFIPNPSLLQANPSAVEALANALFATTSRRASCPEPPASSQATVTLQVPSTGSPERRRYSETNMEVLLREQLAQLMPPTSQLPGMPGCYYQHVPAAGTSGIQGSLDAALMGAVPLAMNSMAHSRRAANHRKARTIYGTTQTQQLEDMFKGQMYVVGAERENLAQRLGLSPSQVRIWFQNRRSKHRRKQQEEQQSTTLEEKSEEIGKDEEEDDEEDEDDVKVLN